MNLVPIGTFYNITTAHIYRTKLESEGIPCYIEAENHHYRRSRLSGLGGIKLVVNEFDIERARLALGLEPGSNLDPHKEGPITCPYCHSVDNKITPLSIKRPLQIMKTLIMVIAGAVFFSPKVHRKCLNCGQTFKG